MIQIIERKEKYFQTRPVDGFILLTSYFPGVGVRRISLVRGNQADCQSV